MKWILTGLLGLIFTLFLTYGMVRFGPELLTRGVMWIGIWSVVLLAVPTIIGWWNWQRSWHGLVILSVYALLVEGFAVYSGIPYGTFVYANIFGAKVAGLVPWTVPFAWVPVAIGSMVIALMLAPHSIAKRVIIGTLGLILYDLVLDPGATRLGYWIWLEPGKYYGVPWTNFGGWLFSSVGGAVLFEKLIHQQQLTQVNRLLLLFPYVLSTLLWAGVAIWTEMYIPAVVGLALSGFVYTLAYQLGRNQTDRHTNSRDGTRSHII